jgi:hypothetical protein
LAEASWRPGTPKRWTYQPAVPTATAVEAARATLDAVEGLAACENVELKRACGG